MRKPRRRITSLAIYAALSSSSNGFGLATAAELQVETLAARMEEEAVALGTQLIGPMQFGAWAVKP